jgi:hypothetical protein
MRRLLLISILLGFSAGSEAHRELRIDSLSDFYCQYHLSRGEMGRLSLQDPKQIQEAPTSTHWLNRLLDHFIGPAPLPLSAYEYRVFYRNQELKGLVARKDAYLDSFRYSLAERRVPEATEFMLTLMHGMGAAKTSHSGTTAPWIRTFAGLDKQGKRIAREWQERRRTPIRIAAEAIDLPESGHGAGPTAVRFGKYRSLEETYARFAKYQHHLRAETNSPQTKFGWLGQSASTELITQFHRFYPAAIDYSILIGPLHRDAELGFKHSYDLHLKEAALPKNEPRSFEPNWEAFHWVNRMYAEMPVFVPNEDPSGGKPMLVLIGENDKEVTESTVAYYRSLAERNTHIHFKIIPNAGHSVLTSSPGYDPTFAYQQIMEFLDSLQSH